MRQGRILELALQGTIREMEEAEKARDKERFFKAGREYDEVKEELNRYAHNNFTEEGA